MEVNQEPLAPADLSQWHRAAAGEHAAQQQLIERMWRVTAFRLRMFRHAEREEIEQNMAAALLRALAAGLQPTENLDGLLVWRGRAEITAFVRTRLRDRRFVGCGEALHCAGHDPAPFEHVTTDELRLQLRDCIDVIPNRDQRESVRLRLVEGLSPPEIADQRAAALPAVRVWISRGAALVRACVEKKLCRARGA